MTTTKCTVGKWYQKTCSMHVWHRPSILKRKQQKQDKAAVPLKHRKIIK
jgi:hypothetical protein